MVSSGRLELTSTLQLSVVQVTYIMNKSTCIYKLTKYTYLTSQHSPNHSSIKNLPSIILYYSTWGVIKYTPLV